MKRILIRTVSIVLIICMILPYNAVLADDREVEGYRKMVCNNFENSLNQSKYYEDLCNDDLYSYKKWMNEIEQKGMIEQAFMWAERVLLDKNLDEDAYVDYLTNLLALMETDLAYVSEVQALYTEKLNIGQQVGEVALSILFTDDSAKDAFENATKIVTTGFNLATKITTDSAEMLVVTATTANFENQVIILNAIKENTNDKNLKKAADKMIELCATQTIFIFEDYVKDMADISKSALSLTGAGIINEISRRLNTGFVAWVREKYAGDAAEEFLAKAAFFANALGCVTLGTEIGSGIMKLFVGNQAESFREIAAMDEISNALKGELQSLKGKAMEGSEEARYNKVAKFVVVAEALAYAHLRGDYCNVQSRNEEERNGAGGKYYKSLSNLMKTHSTTIKAIIENSDFFVMADNIEKDDSNYIVNMTEGEDYKYGYIDIRTGKVVIEPQFSSASDYFRYGLAIVYNDKDECGVINTEGEYLFPFGSIQSAKFYYQGKYLVVKDGDMHYSVYDGFEKVSEWEIAEEEGISSSPGFCTRGGELYTPDRYIPIRVDKDEDNLDIWWYDYTGKLIYKADYWGILAGDSTGYYFFNHGDNAVVVIDNDGNIESVKEIEQSKPTLVEYSGDNWYAATGTNVFTTTIYTNGLTEWTESGMDRYLDLDVSGGVITLENKYLYEDGTELPVKNDCVWDINPVHRNGYFRMERGFVDVYNETVLEYAEGKSRDDYSNVTQGGYIIFKDNGKCGIMTIDGDIICEAKYRRLFGVYGG